MFTFQSSIPERQTKLSTLPHISEPGKLGMASSLGFSVQASQSLSQNILIRDVQQFKHSQGIFNRELQSNDREQLAKLREQLDKIYLREKHDREYWNRKYKDGEKLYEKLQSENVKLLAENESMQRRGKPSLGVGRYSSKSVPVIKVNVPNKKSLESSNINAAHQSEKQSIYRQLRNASEEISNMKKLLESEKQRAEYHQAITKKSIQQLSAEKDSLTAENMNLKNENKHYRDQISKSKQQMNQTYVQLENKVRQQQHLADSGTINLQNFPHEGLSTTQTYKLQSLESQQQTTCRIEEELEKLKLIHRSCDVLIASKDAEIDILKQRITSRPEQKVQPSTPSKLQNTQSIHALSLSHKFPCDQVNHQQFSQHQKSQHSYYQKHLQLSIRQMEKIQISIKQLVNDFVQKIQEKQLELELSHKKSEHQQFQIQKTTQLLNDKKHLIQLYERDLNRYKNRDGLSPVTSHDTEDQYFKQLLKERRQFTN